MLLVVLNIPQFVHWPLRPLDLSHCCHGLRLSWVQIVSTSVTSWLTNQHIASELEMSVKVQSAIVTPAVGLNMLFPSCFFRHSIDFTATDCNSQYKYHRFTHSRFQTGWQFETDPMPIQSQIVHWPCNFRPRQSQTVMPKSIIAYPRP